MTANSTNPIPDLMMIFSCFTAPGAFFTVVLPRMSVFPGFSAFRTFLTILAPIMIVLDLGTALRAFFTIVSQIVICGPDLIALGANASIPFVDT